MPASEILEIRSVSVVLVNGVTLQGFITGFGPDHLLVTRVSEAPMLVMRSALSVTSSATPL